MLYTACMNTETELYRFIPDQNFYTFSIPEHMIDYVPTDADARDNGMVRGDIMQVVSRIVTYHDEKRMVAGAGIQTVKIPIRQPGHTVISSWKWTGKRFVEAK